MADTPPTQVPSEPPPAGSGAPEPAETKPRGRNVAGLNERAKRALRRKKVRAKGRRKGRKRTPRRRDPNKARRLRDKAPRKGKQVQAKPEQAPQARPKPEPEAAKKKRLIDTIRSSPAYMFAIFMHVVGLVLLSFWTVAVHLKEEQKPVAVRIAVTKRLAPISQGETPEEALAAVTANLDKELKGADSDSPFEEAKGELSGALSGALGSKVAGMGAGAGGGLGRGGGGGASAASEAAVHAGLDWLSRHTTRDGVWVQLPPKHRVPADMNYLSGGHVGATGLALVCFMCAKQGPETKGPYQAKVIRARDWLARQVTKSGAFRGYVDGSQAGMYQQAIGTLALAECLSRTPSKSLRDATRRAVNFLQQKRTGFGWRYGRRNETDTSVTSWVILALKAAEHAKIKVSPANYEGVKRWLERVTNRSTGTTGYMSATVRHGDAMTATGLFLRILLGEKPRTRTNRLAAKHTSRIRARSMMRAGAVSNLYAVYYSALAMYQVGGRAWRKFNPKLRDGVVAAQVKDRSCRRGSWQGSIWVRGRVVSTCFAILTLETYYRYLPVYDEALTAGEFALAGAFKLLDRATKASEDQKRALALSAEAEMQAAAKLLIAEKADDDLLAEAQAGLVRTALLLGDGAEVQVRAKRYLELVPRGDPVDPAVTAALKTGRLQEALARFQAAAKAAENALAGVGDDAARQKVRSALAAAAGNLRRQLVGARGMLDSKSTTQLDALLAWAKDVDGLLAIAGNPEKAAADGLKKLAGVPADGPVGQVEKRVFVLLARRAALRFTTARAKKDRAQLAGARADLAILTERSALKRLDPTDAATLRSLLERAALAEIAALLALEELAEALRQAQAFGWRYPESGYKPQAEGIERAILHHRHVQGKANAVERARLFALLMQVDGKQTLPPNESLTLAELLVQRGKLAAAAARFKAVLASKAPSLQIPARLGLAAVARRDGKLPEARAVLEAITGPAKNRLDVILESCRLLRAEGNAEDALKEYTQLLRILERKQRQTWWDIAEQTALTYVEARQIKTARDFLESLRLKDPKLGGNEERRQRILALMRRVDVMKD